MFLCLLAVSAVAQEGDFRDVERYVFDPELGVDTSFLALREGAVGMIYRPPTLDREAGNCTGTLVTQDLMITAGRCGR